MLFIQVIIFSLPLYLVRFSVFGLKTNVLDVFLVLFILWQIINHKTNLRSLSLRITNRDNYTYIIPVTLIVVGAIISTAYSSNFFRSLGILKSYFILPILFFLIASSTIEISKQREKILKMLFSSGFIVAIIGIFYLLTDNLTYDRRLQAFFESPNQLAMFLSPAFIVGSYFIITAQARVRAAIFIGITAIIGVVIFLTKSLGAITAIFISLVYLFIFLRHNLSLYPNKYRHINAKMAILFIFILSIFCFLFSTKDFSEKSSLASRIIIWQSSGAILKDNYVWGIGLGTFQEKYLEYQKYFPPYLDNTVPQPHNIFLAFWLQTGIIGFIGFLWLIFIFFKNIWRNKNDNITFLSGILMIYTLTHGLIDTTYWRNDLVIIFWMIIFLSQSSSLVKSSTQQD